MTFIPPKLNRELLKSSYADATRQRTSFWRPESGPNKIRILPGWVTEQPILPFVALAQHFLGGEEKKSYTCPATPGIDRDCPICKVARLMKRKPSDVEQELGKAISARHVYLWNVIVRGKEGDGVKVLSAAGSAHKEILGYAADDANWPNFLDLERGADIILEKTGTGLQTRYAIRIATPSTPVLRNLAESYKLFEAAPDLIQFLKAETDEVLIKALRKAQDLEDDDDPADDSSAVAAAVARVSKPHPVTVPSSPAGPIGMGLAPDFGEAEAEAGYEVTVEASVDAGEAESVAAPAVATRVVETSVGAAAAVRTPVEATVAPTPAPAPAPAAGPRADLATLKARLRTKLNAGA